MNIMPYAIPLFEPALHGAAGPLDEILMVVAFLGGWGALIYFLLRDRGQRTEEDKNNPEE
jgi:hypothetical protein